MYDWLCHASPDIIHSAALPVSTTWIGWKASRVTGCPFVLTPALHLKDPDFGLSYVCRILRDADAVIALTEIERRHLIGLGVLPEKTWVIPPGVDVENWYGGSASRFRTRMNIAPEDFSILIPRKLEEKGTFHTLAALGELAREGRHPVCIVLGTCPWPVQRRLQSWIARLAAIGTRVLDVGFLPEQEFRDCVAASDVVVEPSMVDSFGIVYQDAWMAGKPVIAASCGASPDVVRDYENGLLVPYGSSNKIAEALRFLMDNPQTARQLGSTGMAQARTEFDDRLIAAEVRRVYETTLAGGGASE